jgi:hypothetical protein
VSVAASTLDRLNVGLARLLAIGTWTSCGLIAIGMASAPLGRPWGGVHLIVSGIVLLIALPTVRVTMMALWFLWNGERDFALIAALVLAIILASTLMGAGAA